MDVDLDQYKRRLADLAKEIQEVPFTTSVLGPGKSDEKGFGKRMAICKELEGKNIPCRTPEDIDAELESEVRGTIPAAQRELYLFQSSDCVIVLQTRTAQGVRYELGQLYALAMHQPSLVRKVIVVHPYRRLPSPPPPESEQPYAASVLRLFPLTVDYTVEEFEQCHLVFDCVDKVESLRHIKWLELKGDSGNLLPR